MQQEKIVEMFNQIAPTYDRANRFLSFGVDTSWRKSACRFVLEKFRGDEVAIVDVACGTGDMIGIWESTAKSLKIAISRIVGIDPSSGMLSVAKRRFPEREFIEAYANETGLESGRADIVSISYGIRNVVEREAALREFNRVLKINGYAVVLEFTKREKGGIITLARDFYLAKILPKIGGFISKNAAAYEYLPNSIENFLSKEDFCAELKNAGFQVEVARGYSFDVSTLFVARKVRNL